MIEAGGMDGFYAALLTKKYERQPDTARSCLEVRHVLCHNHTRYLSGPE